MQGISAGEIPEGFSSVDPNAGGGKAAEPGKAEAQEAQKQQILMSILDADALERLKRIGIVRKEKAVAIENMLVQAAMAGKIPGRVTEAKLIEMLEGMDGAEGQTKVKIQRRNYGIDDSDSEDNDDDLL